MPMNDKNYELLQRWLRNPRTERERLDVIWDQLNNNDRDIVKNRAKADLGANYDARIAATQAEKDDVING